MTRVALCWMAGLFVVGAVTTVVSMAAVADFDAHRKPDVASCIVPGGVEVQR